MIWRLYNYSPRDRLAIIAGIAVSLAGAVAGAICPKILTDIVDAIGDMVAQGTLRITDSLIFSVCLL